MTVRMTGAVYWLVPLTMVAACGDPARDGGLETVAVGCETDDCGTNVASFGNGLEFSEVDGSRVLENSAGLRLIGFNGPGGDPWALVVEGHALVGVDRWGNRHVGQSVDGAVLRFLHRGLDRYEVRIEEVGGTQFWVDPAGSVVPTYRLTYRPVPRSGGSDGSPFLPVCVARHDYSQDWEWTGLETEVAYIFRGDRYEPRTRTVIATGPAVGPWFNVACVGSAMAKMHLLRHTEAGSDPLHQTTRDQRQAMLKMLTDDICGTGRTFTVDGEPVHYMDLRGWHEFDIAQAGTVESIWSAQGAICLDEARRAAEDGPALEAKIDAECAAVGKSLPSCGSIADWTTRGYGLSMNPP